MGQNVRSSGPAYVFVSGSGGSGREAIVVGSLSNFFKNQARKGMRKAAKKAVGKEGYSFLYNLSRLFSGRLTLDKLMRVGRSTSRLTEAMANTVPGGTFRVIEEGSRLEGVPPADEGGYVYVAGLSSRDRYYKIGYSKDPASRVDSLSTGTPYDTELVLAAGPYEKPRRVESRLHERFRDRHFNGEWFELNDGDLTWIRENLG